MDWIVVFGVVPFLLFCLHQILKPDEPDTKGTGPFCPYCGQRMRRKK